MIKQIQRFIAYKNDLLQRWSILVSCTQWPSIFQIKLYVRPTYNQRLRVESSYKVEFAYQKAEVGFDNYSIRAIIRDEHIMNGHKCRPQRHPF